MDNIVHPLNYLLFFPQVIAGPIVRPHELLDQLKGGISLKKEFVKLGLFLILLGLIKKFFIADQLGYLVDNAYTVGSSNPFIGLIFFPWQIYFDFSAYSHMAIGISNIVGLPIKENFIFPYSSKSVSEFWKRWHISLSLWVSDYLYKFLNSKITK